MLNPKEKLILQYLYQHQGRFVPSKELADHLSCSDRTVRTYIKSLLEHLATVDDLDIISKQGFGYQLDVLNEAVYLGFVSDHHLNVSVESIDINDRHNYILNKLIFEQENLFFEDLMEQLYVSRSTLSADLKKIRRELANYQLQVESKVNRGLYVEGSEQDKRRFIMDYFFSGHFLQNIHQYVGDDFFQLPISFEELTIIVLDECRGHDLRLSDFVMQNLIVHIALAIKRVKDGFEISEINIDPNKYRREIEVAENIFARLQKSALPSFPKEEVNYIALHLIADSGQEDTVDEADHISLRQDLIKSCQTLDKSYGYQFSKDFTFIEGLLRHLEVLLERVRHHIHLDNPLLDDIKDQYKESFHLAASLVVHLEHFKDYHLSDDELAYISLHILAAMERQEQTKKYNALVICATGYGSAQILRMRLEKELGSQINIVDVIGYYDICDEKLKDVDLIISTIDLSNLIFAVPVFTVSVFLKDEEVKKIKDKLVQLKSKEASSIGEEKGETDLQVSFDDYFSEAYFKVYEQADKLTVLEDLVNLFYPGQPQEVQSMLRLIAQREQMSSVVFDETIAVPHPIKAFDKCHRIGVAIIQDGLDWDEHFHKIHLVFLVSPSSRQNDGLANLIRRIVALTDDSQAKEVLASCQTFEAFKTLFLKDKGGK